MKKLLLFIFTASLALSTSAELTGDGYYRVQNAYTKRYAYLMDDKGHYDVQTTSADVAALHLYLNLEKVLSDPAAVFYIEKAPVSGSSYDIHAQGTSLHRFLGEYLKIIKSEVYKGAQAYYAYASKSGIVRYLGDFWTIAPSDDRGDASVDCKGKNRYWYIQPLDADGPDYFGVAPSVTISDKYYQPFFASFPFSAKSEGMKFYCIKRVDPVGVAVISELEGTVPSSTPVIVECSDSHPSGNRLNIGLGASMANPSGNLLKGVYFNNDETDHVNRTPFDRNSMRVLGVVDGKLAFVKADHDYIPRNQAYLQLTDASLYSKESIPVMTEAELEEFKNNSVEVIPMDSEVDVYSIDGRRLKTSLPKSEVSSLPKGLYILRSGKNSEKLLLK